MKKRNKGMIFLAVLAAAILCCAASALAESARIITPGGKLNVRKAANEKSKLVTSVPNKALVEVLEVGETWSKISYKKQTGYVKTEFLKLPSQLPGQTVYADEGTLLLRAKADQTAPIVAPVGRQEAVKVVSVKGDWAEVTHGKITGYVPVSAFSYQNTGASGGAEWISEDAVVSKACKMRLSEDPASEVLLSLSAGKKGTVTVIQGKYCLANFESTWGYVPIASLCLTGVEDSGEKAGSLTPVQAITAAMESLTKNDKTFAKGRFYYNVSLYASSKNGIKGPLYHCAFYNDRDQYQYGALVNAKTGKVVFEKKYSGFAVPAAEKEELLAAGEIEVTLSAEKIAVGDVLDVTVKAWTRKQCQYLLEMDGKKIVSTEAGTHFTAAYRPKDAGKYQLTVTVKDAKGRAESKKVSFQVTESKKKTSSQTIYSQKDGWWRSVSYRKSNMDHSGCAIFALSHALQRLGYTGSDILPANLAKKYAMCLTPEGTNNEWLIRAAAADFGFKTQRLLYKDTKQIAALLKQGALFSFSVARGHIAMIGGLSEDGQMVKVVDSAPQATFERIVNTAMYYQLRSGSFRAAVTLDDLPGARWYMNTDEYGGMEYWMPIEYAAKRGVRLIQKDASAKQE